MRHRFLLSIALSLSCVFLGSIRAAADPVVVTSGALSNFYTSARFEFIGEGMWLRAFPENGLLSPMFMNCHPCRSERAVGLSFDATYLGGSFSSGLPGTFDGVAYERTFLSGSIFIDGPEFTSAALSPSSLVFTAPFTMRATIVNYDSSPRLGPPLFTASLIGSGTATARFSTVEDGLGGRVFDAFSVQYEFEAAAPTPEPGTLLLLGSGIALVVRRRVRRTVHPPERRRSLFSRRPLQLFSRRMLKAQLR